MFYSLCAMARIRYLVFFLILSVSNYSWGDPLEDCSIYDGPVRSIIKFAYSAKRANWPFKESENVLGKPAMVSDNSNSYPQVAQLVGPKSSGKVAFIGTAFFVKDGDGNNVIRTAMHNFFNGQKLKGPLGAFKYRMEDKNGRLRDYKIKSIRCGNENRIGAYNYDDQCEVKLEEDLPLGLKPLELDANWIKKQKMSKVQHPNCEIPGYHGYPKRWRGFRSINRCGYVNDLGMYKQKEHLKKSKTKDPFWDELIGQEFYVEANLSMGTSGAPMIVDGKVVGMVTAEGIPERNNIVVPLMTSGEFNKPILSGQEGKYWP